MKKYLTPTLLATVLCACGQKLLTQEDESKKIDALWTEITSLASSVLCENAALWNFTAYGSKACGGPVGFIAYPNEIDTVDFLAKVEAHAQLQQDFNKRWGMMSDCAVPPTPREILCVEGSATFNY